jgi:LDH2 family malate/lactate/ureidoglycolate dehydrogenase
VPQTFDFATSEVVWGEIRQATLEGRGLVSGPFLSSAGDVTTAPSEVDAVRAFGGRRGWALNLAIEMLAGPLAGGRAGLDVKGQVLLIRSAPYLIRFEPAVQKAAMEMSGVQAIVAEAQST